MQHEPDLARAAPRQKLRIPAYGRQIPCAGRRLAAPRGSEDYNRQFRKRRTRARR